MEKKAKSPFEEFIPFRSEKERVLWKWLVVGNSFFLISTFILVFVSEKIFKLGALSFFNYWVLVVANILVFTFFGLCLVKNFKIWLLKYVLAVYLPLLIIGWVYFTGIEYAKPIFGVSIVAIITISFMFHDLKVFLLSTFATAVFWGLLFFNYLKSGAPITLYEISLFYILLFFLTIMNFPILQRTRFFLTELIEKRREAEEAREILEVKVQARTKELKELADSLDQQVKDRTKELQERVDQLQRFQRLTIGRELRMAELKKKIKELEEEKKE